jgi:hypothetical protein
MPARGSKRAAKAPTAASAASKKSRPAAAASAVALADEVEVEPLCSGLLLDDAQCTKSSTPSSRRQVSCVEPVC